MKAQFYNILFSIIILFTAKTHTLPTLSLNTTDLDSTLAGVKTGVNCWHPTISGSRLAATRDCLQATLLLPDSSDAKIFHNGDLYDDWKLPVVKVYGSCLATVSLMQGATHDRSSWDHISFVASQMAAICSVGNFPVGQTGGITTAGYENNIRVTLEKAFNGGGNVS